MKQDTKKLVAEMRMRTCLAGPAIGKIADLIEQYEIKQNEFIDAIKKWSDHTGIAVCMHCAGPAVGDTGISALCTGCFERGVESLASDLEEAYSEQSDVVSTGKVVRSSGQGSSSGSAYDLSNQRGV